MKMDRSVQNFIYNGFFVQLLPNKTKYTVNSLINWTQDPGIGLFLCSDKKERLIPSCCLSKDFLLTQKKRPKLNPFKGKGVLFGEPAKS
jgi:hypothetical protein